jgi:hypothetical protein
MTPDIDMHSHLAKKSLSATISASSTTITSDLGIKGPAGSKTHLDSALSALRDEQALAGLTSKFKAQLMFDVQKSNAAQATVTKKPAEAWCTEWQSRPSRHDQQQQLWCNAPEPTPPAALALYVLTYSG